MDTFRPNKLQQLQDALHQAHSIAEGAGAGGGERGSTGVGSSSSSSKRKRRPNSMVDGALSCPRTATHIGASVASSGSGAVAKPAASVSNNDHTKRKQKTPQKKGAGDNKPTRSKTARKPKQRKQNNSIYPPPVVCVAHESLATRIGQLPSAQLNDVEKAHINNLPAVPYGGTKRIVVVDDASSSDDAVAAIWAELEQQKSSSTSNGNGDDGGSGSGSGSGTDSFHYLGFDTETRPKFHKGGNPNPVALIQLATPSTAYLFRLSFQGMGRGGGAMTNALRGILSNNTVIKVGVGIRDDVSALNRCHGVSCCGTGSSFLDLGPLARLRWPMVRKVGLRNLTATVLGWKLSKAQQMKNWEMKLLTEAMEGYAAADALVALDLLGAIVA